MHDVSNENHVIILHFYFSVNLNFNVNFNIYRDFFFQNHLKFKPQQTRIHHHLLFTLDTDRQTDTFRCVISDQKALLKQTDVPV